MDRCPQEVKGAGLQRGEPTVTEAGWWDAGGRSLFGSLHYPASYRVRGSVVLCPPLFWEYAAAHETYRTLADDCARAGMAVLRFDYTGTGDSSGIPSEVEDVSLWMDDIKGAVCQLRRWGSPFVAVVGMRAASNVIASTPGLNADAVVLWDPAESGRIYLRQVTLLYKSVLGAEKVEGGRAQDELGAQARPNADFPLGFDFPQSFVSSLRQLSLSDAEYEVSSLVLTRSGDLPVALAANPQMTVGAASGQEELLEVFLETARTPTAACTTILEWLRGQQESLEAVPFSGGLHESWIDPQNPSVIERVARIGDAEGQGLFAITTEHIRTNTLDGTQRNRSQEDTGADDHRLTCLMFNSGTEWHIGPHRLYVDLARRVANKWIRSIRLDFRGIGDSPQGYPRAGHHAYSPWILDDLDAAVSAAPEGPIVALGLCSGAYHALEAAARHQLFGVIPINLGADFANIAVRPWGATSKAMPKNNLSGWMKFSGRTTDLSADSRSSSSTAAPNRRVAPIVADRPWLRIAKRNRLGMAIIWRLPGPGWWLLDKLRLQPDLGRGIAEARRTGARLVLFLERRRMREPKLWPLLHRRRDRIEIVPTYGDHSLWEVRARSEVMRQCNDILVNWSTASTR